MAALELFNSSLFSDVNLVSYYRLEGNANDAKGANNGTGSNVTYASGNGLFGQGAKFSNASSSYINLGTPSNLQFSSAYTLMVRINIASVPATGRVIFGKWDTVGGVNTRTINMYLTSTGTVNFSQSTDGTDAGAVAIESTTILTTATWHLVVGTWDGSKIHLYIDGSEEGTGASIASIKSSPNCQWGIGADLGRSGDPVSASFDDKMDDVAFFNRSLSANEVSSRWNGTDLAASLSSFGDEGQF